MCLFPKKCDFCVHFEFFLIVLFLEIRMLTCQKGTTQQTWVMMCIYTQKSINVLQQKETSVWSICFILNPQMRDIQDPHLPCPCGRCLQPMIWVGFMIRNILTVFLVSKDRRFLNLKKIKKCLTLLKKCVVCENFKMSVFQIEKLF